MSKARYEKILPQSEIAKEYGFENRIKVKAGLKNDIKSAAPLLTKIKAAKTHIFASPNFTPGTDEGIKLASSNDNAEESASKSAVYAMLL